MAEKVGNSSRNPRRRQDEGGDGEEEEGGDKHEDSLPYTRSRGSQGEGYLGGGLGEELKLASSPECTSGKHTGQANKRLGASAAGRWGQMRGNVRAGENTALTKLTRVTGRW